MTINLFAPSLRAPAEAPLSNVEQAGAARPRDFGRWVLGGLVATRGEPASWGLQRSTRDAGSRRGSGAGSRDAVWADTQPWCHE